MVTKRRIRPKQDFKRIETYVKDEYERRKKSPFRVNHEKIWTEVDRQVSMEAMKRVSQTGKPIPQGWNSVFELGELAKASEIIAADVMRIVFPDERSWFEPHVKIDRRMQEDGTPAPIDPKEQVIRDGVLRSLMVQQHQDFGLKARFKLSVKEALHHGSFVAEVRFEKEMTVRAGDRVQMLGAPVWVPHSMWNSFPDPSPAIHGTNLFYNGSMIIREFMPRWKLEQMKGEGWMQSQFDKIPDEEHTNKDNKTKDIELVRYLGDLNIERDDGDIYLPNSKAILANGILIFWQENELPFPPVIFNGYERQDVRDPYYTSPLIKQSPMQKFTTIMANKFVDAVELKVNPPVEYDKNDPDYAMNDGPDLSPGAKSGTRSMGKGFKALELGDPGAALEAMTLGMRQLQEGTGVSSIRTGIASSDRQTATEVRKVAQGAEVRTVDFVSVLEPGGLRPFLYMQHMLNRENLEPYEFFNNEMHTPDWVRYERRDIDHDAHFDIVGSKGLLGEEQRTERVAQVTAFASGNPLFAPLLKPSDILMEMYRNAGQKSPEQFVQVDQPQVPPQVQAQLQQAGQMVQALQAELQKMQGALKDKSEELRVKQQEMLGKLEIEQQKAVLSNQQKLKEIMADFLLGIQKIQSEAQLEIAQMRQDAALERQKIITEVEPELIKAFGTIVAPHIQKVEERTQSETLRLIGELSKAVDAIRSDVKKSRTRRMLPKLNADGDVIGGEVETEGGERYGITLQ